jgi:hypothetical protein
MFPWFLKQKERNMILTEATTTELPIPLATEAKRMSTENLDTRIKRAEKAIFDEACDYINDAIKHGYMTTTFDAFFSVNRVLVLDKSSIVAAINDCIEHLSTFGYTAKRDGEKHLNISWQYPKEITLNDIEWSV